MSCRKGDSGEHIFMCYPVYMSLYRLLCHAERETAVDASPYDMTIMVIIIIIQFNYK